jgi:hypothetical protein
MESFIALGSDLVSTYNGSRHCWPICFSKSPLRAVWRPIPSSSLPSLSRQVMQRLRMQFAPPKLSYCSIFVWLPLYHTFHLWSPHRVDPRETHPLPTAGLVLPLDAFRRHLYSACDFGSLANGHCVMNHVRRIPLCLPAKIQSGGCISVRVQRASELLDQGAGPFIKELAFSLVWPMRKDPNRNEVAVSIAG